VAHQSLTLSKEERTGTGGQTIRTDRLLHILSTKLRYPLATHEVLAGMTNCSMATVSLALTTPYAQRYLTSDDDTMAQYAVQLHATQGDGIVYMDRSVKRGILEIEKPRPQAPVLQNASKTVEMVSKITGLLQDRLRLTDDTKDSLDYAGALEIDATIIDALEQGEGEGPGTPGSDVEETPTTPDPKPDE
jgi:hypothetical protein